MSLGRGNVAAKGWCWEIPCVDPVAAGPHDEALDRNAEALRAVKAGSRHGG